MNQLITNTPSNNFYNHIISLLESCDSFIFNVAFLNYSGVQLLLNSLEKCRQKGVKGKILTSTYLDFTEPKALSKLLEFENIELKIFDSSSQGFHSKAYIFKFENEYKTIIGSSNITSSAFKTNIEWNNQSINKKDDRYLETVFNEFDSLWSESIKVDKSFIDSYSSYKKELVKKRFIFNKEIKTNLMQKQALEKLDFFRKNKENKALVIAATGTGKTYLAAFDVKKVKPKRLLFIVHRENILNKAKECFESLIDDFDMGLFTGNNKDILKPYIFATIQTLSSNYEIFKKDEFDYIIYDEAHHIASPSYKKVKDYFDAKFNLGLTATPNRMDGLSIYEQFDDNIACDIRLDEALENKLVSTFHYYGVSDIKELDYEKIDLSDISSLSRFLMINRRVDFIIEKMNFYGYSGNKRRVLAFCSSKEHAFYMAEEFNKRGITSIALTSDDNTQKRDELINSLEDAEKKLEVIFSVDIFNEGIDIPSVNTVLMLRPTNSPIVFVQQLGRGVRRSKDKEFLTLIDFIGNHKKSFLIALALCGKKIIDKESIKFSLLNNFANFKNAHIILDEISKSRIIEQINKENLNSFKYLKDNYLEFKAILGNKIPSMEDFINYDDFINPIPFISESKSFISFLNRVEKNEDIKIICLDENFLKASAFIDYHLPLRRIYEFAILKYLLNNKKIDLNKAKEVLKKYLLNVDENTIRHSFSYLNQEFFDSSQQKRFLKLIEKKDSEICLTDEFQEILKDRYKRSFIESSLNYGIITYEESFSNKDYGLPFFKLYEKYNMLEIALLSNFNKIHSSFRGSGFLKFKDDFFLFITLEKDKYSKASKYVNNFKSNDTFNFVSKPSMSQDKGDGYRLINNKKENVKLHIFVRKFSHVDKKVQKFIYLGLADCDSYSGNKPIDTQLILKKPLSDKLYHEFTEII
ncbi:DEAD/DEAH box helicase [Halarcobacter sp.]|uniref:DEAD/DEAH box helicase n=1 Tax=Halarcobacter sp. TaxID=2321133 RepID=UPI002AA8B2BF|nr:DEAD/DEAH box helicase [Halarcobacter sp.]